MAIRIFIISRIALCFISNYFLKDRRQVESITIDMNAGYVNVIKEVFPQAKIIIDRSFSFSSINQSLHE